MSDWPEITKDTPIEELREIHRRIWEEVVLTGFKPETPYAGHCVGCEYAIKIRDDDSRWLCEYCPIDWPNHKVCGCFDSIYRQRAREWLSGRFLEAQELAKRIRDVPFKSQ